MPENAQNTPEAADRESARDARFQLTISKDKLQVTLNIIQLPDEGGQLLTSAQIHAELKKLKVKHGINDTAIASVVAIVNQGRRPGYDHNSEIVALENVLESGTSEETAETAIIIAHGDMPVPGADASLDWTLDTTTELAIVLPGDLIATYHPAADGTAGRSVLGEPLYADSGSDRTAKPGAGIEPITTQGGIEYRAKWYGQCHATDTLLDVTCPLAIAADRMSATLDFYPPVDMARTVKMEHIRQTLESHGISAGIDETCIRQALERLASERRAILNQVVAKGRPAHDGNDMHIAWGEGLPAGKAGVYDVGPGYRIATISSASPGQPGHDINGTVLPCRDGETRQLQTTGHIITDQQDGTYTCAVAGTLTIAHNDSGFSLALDPHLSISDDRLEATLALKLTTVDGGRLTLADIRTTLTTCGVIYGICDELIDNALQTTGADARIPVTVARGTPPQHGIDAYIHYLKAGQVAGKLLTHGRIDFHEQNYPWTFKRGETIAYFIQAKEETDGTDVRGTTIPASPPATLDLDLEGAHLDENNRIIADIDGTLIVSGNKLSIAELLVVDGNVGARTGNIHCDNDIHVKGYIEPGFKIHGGRSVIIDKNVEDASVTCSGTVTIKGGIRGLKSAVFTPGDLHAGFIEHASISVNGDIHVAESIINSEIGSNGVITAGSNRARHSAIIGGHTRAFNRVEARVLGSKSFHQTIISVGYTQEMKQRQHDIRSEIEAREHELRQLEQLENFYQRHEREEAQEVLHKTRLTRATLIDELGALKRKLDEIIKEAEAIGGICVVVHKKIYPGVVIKIDDHIYEVSQEMNGGVFTLQDNAIVYRPELPHSGDSRGRRRN